MNTSIVNSLLVPLNDWYDYPPPKVVTRETWEQSKFSREKNIAVVAGTLAVCFFSLRFAAKLAEHKTATALCTFGMWSCIAVTGVAVLIGLTGGIPPVNSRRTMNGVGGELGWHSLRSVSRWQYKPSRCRVRPSPEI